MIFHLECSDLDTDGNHPLSPDHTASWWRVWAFGANRDTDTPVWQSGPGQSGPDETNLTSIDTSDLPAEVYEFDVAHRDGLWLWSDFSDTVAFGPCNVGWRVTLFESDDATPLFGVVDTDGNVVEADFATGPLCPRPFLKWPKGISESQINFEEGSGSIGAMNVQVIDKRLDPADQATGIVTSIVSKLRDARCLVEAFEDGAWRVVMDGAVQSFRLLPTLVTYEISIRDIRERERDYSIFTTNDTWAVYPERGAADGYGFGIGGGEPLMPPAATYQGTFVAGFDGLPGRTQGYVATSDFFEKLDADIRALGVPASGFDDSGFIPVAKYPQLTVRWRPADAAASACNGSPSTARVLNMLETAPDDLLDQLASAYGLANGGDPLPSDPNDLAFHAMGGDDCQTTTAAGVRLKRIFLQMTAAYGGTENDWTYLHDSQIVATITPPGNLFVAGNGSIADDGSVANPTNYVPSSNAVQILLEGLDAEMPADGDEVEIQVLARLVSESTPFVWEGSFGLLLQLCYDGYFSDRAPRLRYNVDRMEELKATTPIARLKKTQSEDDMRTWLQENWYKPLHMAPGVDDHGQIYPVADTLPPSGSALEQLDNDNVAPDAEWEAGIEGGISTVEFYYVRESRVQVVTSEDIVVKKKGLFGLDFLKKDKHITVNNITYEIQEQTVRDVFISTLAATNGKKITYKPETVRVLGGVNGAPLTGDTMDETGTQLAVACAQGAFGRFPNIVPRITLRVRGSTAAAKNLKMGMWCRVQLSWLPDPDTGTRGCDRVMQVLARRPPVEDGWVRFSLIDGGPAIESEIPVNITVDPDPYFDADGLPTAVVTVVPDGYMGRIDLALSFTGSAPAADSPDWQPMTAAIIVPGAYKSSFPVPVNTSAYMRWRAEKLGQQPGPWSVPVLLTGTNDAPALLNSSIAIDLDTGDVTVSWRAGTSVVGVRVYYDVVADGDVPDLATDFVDVDATDGSVVLPETVPIGNDPYIAAAKIEPWSVYPISGGTAGTAQKRTARYPGKSELPISEGETDDKIAAAIAALDIPFYLSDGTVARLTVL